MMCIAVLVGFKSFNIYPFYFFTAGDTESLGSSFFCKNTDAFARGLVKFADLNSITVIEKISNGVSRFISEMLLYFNKFRVRNFNGLGCQFEVSFSIFKFKV